MAKVTLYNNKVKPYHFTSLSSLIKIYNQLLAWAKNNHINPDDVRLDFDTGYEYPEQREPGVCLSVYGQREETAGEREFRQEKEIETKKMCRERDEQEINRLKSLYPEKFK